MAIISATTYYKPAHYFLTAIARNFVTILALSAPWETVGVGDTAIIVCTTAVVASPPWNLVGHFVV